MDLLENRIRLAENHSMKLSRQFKAAWRGTAPPGVMVILFGALCLFLCTGIRWGVSYLRPDTPFTPYVPAIILLTMFGGVRAGIATAVIGSILGYAISFGSFTQGATLPLLLIYLIISGVVIWGIQHYRTIATQNREISTLLIEEEKYRKLVIGELEHRLKNKLATIHAVARHSLHRYPEAWAALDGRIRALSLTDDLIAKADNAACGLREILAFELEPYGHVRYTLSGENVTLPAKLAVAMALLFHELATNAAKYGSFASGGGVLQVSWTLLDRNLNIIWDETGGPAVKPPAKTGFGLKLINSVLAGFDGKVDLHFLETGLRCTIKCVISETLRTQRTTSVTKELDDWRSGV